VIKDFPADRIKAAAEVVRGASKDPRSRSDQVGEVNELWDEEDQQWRGALIRKGCVTTRKGLNREGRPYEVVTDGSVKRLKTSPALILHASNGVPPGTIHPPYFFLSFPFFFIVNFQTGTITLLIGVPR